MIPTPIRQTLSTIRAFGVQTLLTGGQACMIHGAAQVRKDIDLMLLPEPGNYERLRAARRAASAAHRVAALLSRGAPTARQSSIPLEHLLEQRRAPAHHFVPPVQHEQLFCAVQQKLLDLLEG